MGHRVLELSTKLLTHGELSTKLLTHGAQGVRAINKTIDTPSFYFGEKSTKVYWEAWINRTVLRWDLN